MATLALGSYWERVEYSLTYLRFASFNAPYQPMRRMYVKRTASIQFLRLRLMVPKIRYTRTNEICYFIPRSERSVQVKGCVPNAYEQKVR